MKFQIKEFIDETIVVDVLEGSEVLFTREIKITSDLDIDRLKRRLRDEAERIAKEQKKKDEFNLVVDVLKKELNKKLDL